MAAVAAATAFYLVMIVLSNIDDFIAASREFSWIYIVPVIASVLANYVIRSERWHLYLRDVGLGLPRRRSYHIFLSGLSMSVTPAKIGEALKGVLLKMERGSPIQRGVGIVVVERISDVLGMCVLIAIGAVVLPYGMVSFSLVVIGLFTLIMVISSESLSARAVRWLKGTQRLKRLGEMAEEPLRDSRRLLTGGSMVRGSVLSVAAWGCECLAFFLILSGSSADIGILESIFIYAFSSVIGAVSMLPGGMGTTEATMMGLLLLQGASTSAASFAVILTRVCTLWFAVGVGVASLGFFRRREQEASSRVVA